ncbi:MAG TPA: GTP-binding protein [Clostridiales bacterium]|nr:GTP-binding protein [Clostridiales bacterium]
MAEINNELLKIVVVGHVDHGKSTVIGRLLYDTHSLPEGTVNKVQRIAKETGKPFEYAYLLDAFEEEQKQGITIDTTQIHFQTEKRNYVIIDAPGHKEFLKNMISGAANAEAAFLIIDAQEGVKEQSKRHAYILSLLGIKKVYVVLNKMDLVDYSEEVYESVKKDMSEFLSTLKVYPIGYIPVSAYYGENILTSSEKLDWFNGESIIGAIDNIEKDKGLEHKSLRFPIQDVYKFDDRRIISGRVESGTIKVGDEISIYPEGKKTHVKTVEHWAERDNKDYALAGESSGITVADEFFNKRGEIIAFEQDKPFVSNRFKANVFWMGKNDLVLDKKYKIKLATQEVECEVESILKVIDASTLDSTDKQISKIALNDVAEVIIATKEAVAFDRFSDNHATGRFVIVDGYDVAGGGIIAESEAVKESEYSVIFKNGDLIARGDIFEEFLYDTQSFEVVKVENVTGVYSIGDSVPLKTKGFQYPENYDIIVLRDKVAVKIREGKVGDIIPISEYKFDGYPVTNGRGFEVNAKSQDEIEQFFKEYNETDDRTESEFLNRWLKFDSFRSVIFFNNH